MNHSFSVKWNSLADRGTALFKVSSKFYIATNVGWKLDTNIHEKASGNYQTVI